MVDLRKNSPTYGQSYSIELTSEEKTMLYVPEGLAHGFQVLSDSCLFFYKCTNVYHRESDGGIYWNDPALENFHGMIFLQSFPKKIKIIPLLADFDSSF